MKNEKGLGVIGIILIIIVIIALVIISVNLINNYMAKQEEESIKSNMLLIQGACRVIKQNSIAQKKDDIFIGTKISEMTEDQIINEFKSKNIVEQEKYDKYYCLNNENLRELNLEIENEENSYYLVNYDDDEIIITSGYRDKYKLSEIIELEK